MFYESLIILNISTLNFSEGVPASVIVIVDKLPRSFDFFILLYDIHASKKIRKKKLNEEINQVPEKEIEP